MSSCSPFYSPSLSQLPWSYILILSIFSSLILYLGFSNARSGSLVFLDDFLGTTRKYPWALQACPLFNLQWALHLAPTFTSLTTIILTYQSNNLLFIKFLVITMIFLSFLTPKWETLKISSLLSISHYIF